MEERDRRDGTSEVSQSEEGWLLRCLWDGSGPVVVMKVVKAAGAKGPSRITFDGTPYEVKASRTVWGGGKARDYFKGLPIAMKYYLGSRAHVSLVGVSH